MKLIGRNGQRWMTGAALLIVSLVTMTLLWRGQVSASETFPPGEAFRFNHQKHIAAGAECLFCHSNALNGVVAGVPSVQKCIGCHQNVQVTSEAGQANVDVLFEYWEAGRPLEWEKTYDQPDFVYFPHQPHIEGGVNCERCHGDVSQMETVRLAYRINMGFCLHCHRQQGADRIERLESCSTCHQ
jgi:hypothetical protein